MGVSARKDVAGDDEQVVRDRLGDERGRGAPGGAREGVEGAFGPGEVVKPFQGGDDGVTPRIGGRDARTRTAAFTAGAIFGTRTFSESLLGQATATWR